MENFEKKGPPPINISRNNLARDAAKHLKEQKIFKPRKGGKKNLVGILVILILGGLAILGFFGYDLRKKRTETAEQVKEPTAQNLQAFENQDEDNDGLTTVQELEAGTKVKEEDTDLDGIPDGWEVTRKLNPLDYTDALNDDDEDKLTNLEEYRYGTDPAKDDTDDDGFKDGHEIENGFNPKGPGKLSPEAVVE